MEICCKNFMDELLREWLRSDRWGALRSIHIWRSTFTWLVVEPTPLKNISQNGNLPQIGVKIKKCHLKPPPSHWLDTISPPGSYETIPARSPCPTPGQGRWPAPWVGKSMGKSWMATTTHWLNRCFSSWWLGRVGPPIWKIWSSQWVHLPQCFGWKLKNRNHHLVFVCTLVDWTSEMPSIVSIVIFHAFLPFSVFKLVSLKETRGETAPQIRSKGIVSLKTSHLVIRLLQCYLIHLIQWIQDTLSLPKIPGPSTFALSPLYSLSGWWFQPIWKICSSNWIISPSRGENFKKMKPPVSSCVVSSRPVLSIMW